MKKKIIIILIAVLISSALISAGLYYLNTYYLPQIVKTKIAEEASKQLGALFEIGDIKLSLFKGIVIHNIHIRNKKDSSPILQADRLSLNFLILPFFKERKIIFPAIGIDGAKINLIRHEDNTFNIQSLIPKQLPAKNAGKKSPPPIIVYRIDVNNSSVYFLDKAVSPNLEHTLKLNNVKVQLSPSAINFNLRGALINTKQTANIKLSGSFQFKDSGLKISSQIDNLDVTAYLAYLNNLPAEINALSLSGIDIEADLLDNKLLGQTSMDIKGASFSKDKSSVSQASAKINASFDVDLRNVSRWNYLINADGVSANLSDPQLPKDTFVTNAKLAVTPDSMDVQGLTIKTLGTSVDIKGKLKDFLNPAFNFNVETTIDIPTARNFIKNYVTIDESILADGKADVNIDITKEKDKKEFSYKGSLNLTNASVKAANAPYAIKTINGLINFDNKTASWSDLSFNFMDNAFKSKTTITNFTSPSIDLELHSDKMDISAKINSAQQNNFNIEYLKGTYYNSRLDLSGNLSIKEQNNVYADLKLQSRINLEDLPQIPYLVIPNLDQIKPQGILNIDAKFKGNVQDIKSLNGTVNFTSDELKLYGLSLKALQVSMVEEGQQVKIPSSQAKFYDGTISLSGIMDLSKENKPYIISLSAENIDLSKLKLDTPIKDQELEGMLMAMLVLNGNIDANPLAALKGKGQFLIKDGYLWEFNPLKKLGDFLFIPRYETLIFKQAKGDFTIAEQKASTENLTLDSNVISLACEGSIDFAGNLDFEIAPYPAAQQPQKTGQTGTETIAATPQNILSDEMVKLAGISIIKVTGTIQNPKISMKMVTKEVVDKLKEGVKGTVNTVKDVVDLIFGGGQE